MTKPYCYLLGWPDLDKWYYGVRWAKKCDPSDLCVTYFTSSKRGIDHPYYGKTHSDIFGDKSGEYKKIISDMFKGVPKQQVQCPHCDKIGGKNTMGRWHFDNCKEKIEGKQ